MDESWYLWSTNKKVGHLNQLFLDVHILARRAYCPLKFLHAPGNDQGFPTHTARGTGVPIQQFLTMKIEKMAQSSAYERR